jgi:hypothetical protein
MLMAVIPMPREKWTDERLDDLNKKVDDGFARAEGVRELHAKVKSQGESLRREIKDQGESLPSEMTAHFERLDSRFETVHARFDKMYGVFCPFAAGL